MFDICLNVYVDRLTKSLMVGGFIHDLHCSPLGQSSDLYTLLNPDLPLSASLS